MKKLLIIGASILQVPAIKKAKELFAVLIDRNGAGMTGKQICAVMWPENTDDVKNMDYLRHLVGDLKKSLAQVGAERVFCQDGYNYRILVRKDNSGTQYFDEPKEDIVSNAIYERNKAVEDRFGITISLSETNNADYEAEALNTILAGDDAYDVIYPHSRAAFLYAVRGACVNLHDVSTLHLNKPWWSKDIVDSCTINGNLYWIHW